MYALFLEAEAASQIDRYVAANGGDSDAIKQRAYAESLEQRGYYGRGKTKEDASNWWVNKCLEGDSHKELDIDSLFIWSNSAEGHDYWRAISLL